MTKFTSIIIPVYNSEKTISLCLDSIFSISTSKSEYEVIIIDNGSVDSTIEILENYDVTTYIKPNLTISSLRNFGAHKSKGQIFGFVDSDCLVSKDWLNAAVTHFNDDKIGIVGSHYTIPENCNWVGLAWDILSEKRNFKGVIDQLPGGNMLISKECFEHINGFDNGLITCEDVDLCYRAKIAGYCIFSDPLVKVVHLGDCLSLWQFFKKEIWRGQEVFRIYLRDRRSVNFKATVFALFYLFLLTTICMSGFNSVAFNKSNYVFLFSVSLYIGAPVLLSFRAIRKIKKRYYLFNLAVIYAVFGTARAIAILKTLTKIFKKL